MCARTLSCCVLLFCLGLGPLWAHEGKALSAAPKILGAVATQHPLATQTAAKILQRGGNAFDAVIAAALTLSVVEPYNSGLGAGGFALLWDADQRQAVALDFRETAPDRSHAGLFLHHSSPQASQMGPLAIAVPGEMAGLQHLHQRWGQLEWKQLFADAIALAEQGFVPSSYFLQRVQQKSDCLSRDYNSWKLYQPLFSNPENPEVEGPKPWVQQDLAQTLKRLRDHGAQEFYTGVTAQQLLTNLQGKGALLTQKDLQTYQVVERDPVMARFAWGQVWGFPLPSSGGISVLRALNTLEAMGKKQPKQVASYWPRWMVLVLDRVFATRNTQMGDGDFLKNSPVKKWISKALARKEAHELLKQPEVSSLSSPQEGSMKSKGETTHLVVMDAQGNGVSMTLTQNLSFGSCVTAGSTGILMNNQMDDFTTHPGQANAFGLVQGAANTIAPGKRPLSSMSPTLVTRKKKLQLAMGSPGGPRIITSVLQVLYRHYFLQEGWSQAVAAPRFHYQGLPAKIFLEQATLGSNFQGLGLALEPNPPWSNVQLVAYQSQTGQFQAVSDPRGIGVAQIVISREKKEKTTTPETGTRNPK